MRCTPGVAGRDRPFIHLLAHQMTFQLRL